MTKKTQQNPGCAAALAGDSDAAALVGDLYVRNGRLPPNYTEAAGWYRRAAEGGHIAAARALGSLYLTGAGVAADPGTGPKRALSANRSSRC